MASATALLQEIQLRLGEVRDELGPVIATQFATAVGTAGKSLVGTPNTHQHPMALGTAAMVQNISLGTSSGGHLPYFARADHQHYFNFGATFGVQVSNVSIATSTVGVDSAVSHADHVHYLIPGQTASMAAIGIANDAGVSTHIARIDHTHGGNVNYAATATMCNVSMAAADAGTHTTVARGDHIHLLAAAATATLCNVSWAAGDAGTHASVARGDHVHRLPAGTRTMVQATRTTSTVYTNNGTGPMYIGISLALSTPGAEGAHLQVGGTDVAHGDANANVHFFIMGIANAGEEYLLTATGGAHIDHWMEYGF